MKVLADQIDDALPQTQCTRCGYVDCRNYAEAMADGEAGINQCPPGGAEGIVRLAALTGQAVIPLWAGNDWAIYNNAHFTGWPTKENNYSYGFPNGGNTPEWLIVLTTISAK